jgi:hypothetical protein
MLKSCKTNKGGKVSFLRYEEDKYWRDEEKGHFKVWVLPLVVLFGAILITVCLNFAGCSVGYTVSKAVSAPYELAADAPDAAFTLLYLDQLDAGLVSQNATTGHTALIFKTDANSLSVYRTNLTELRARAHYVAALDQSSISYQYAIANLKEATQNLGNPNNGIVWVQYWWLTGLIVLAYVGSAVSFLWLFVRLTV